MGSYVNYMVSTDRRASPRPILEANDNGTSHSPMLDVCLRMLAEYRRIFNSRERQFTRDDLLLSAKEVTRIGQASVYASRK